MAVAVAVAMSEVSLGIASGFIASTVNLIRVLDQSIQWRGAPPMIRCDNGPENISAAIQQWAKHRGTEMLRIQPGKPQQNAYVERSNRTVRFDWLSQ